MIFVIIAKANSAKFARIDTFSVKKSNFLSSPIFYRFEPINSIINFASLGLQVDPSKIHLKQTIANYDFPLVLLRFTLYCFFY
jgi:hypothetical protein